jgi:DNA polymerase-3 subunit delta
MAVLKTTELQGLLKSGAEKFDAFLIHGLDVGQVAELGKSIAVRLSEASSPPGDIIRLSEQDLAQTPGRLAGEARSLAMFGGRPVIMVKQGPQLTPALFEELFGGPPLAAYIVVEAGNLKRDAKLRQIFEKAKNAAAIACYGADRGSLAQLIREEVQAAGLTITRDAADRLNQLLGADWAVSRGEVAKLTLYAQGEREITLEHVEAVVGDASAHAFDAAIAETLGGNAAAALGHLDGLVGAGTPASVFLTLLGGYLQKLHAVLAATERGESFDSAVAKVRPPLHFRQKDAMRAQAGRWRLPEVAAAIAAAHETLRQTRLKPALEDALVATLILRLCRAGRRRAA